MSKIRIHFLIILPLALMPPLAALAQTTWYSAYESALQDISAGHWEQSVEHLQQSLAIKPVPELNARTYGVWRKDYLPLYHLGVAYFNKGDYQRALDYFPALPGCRGDHSPAGIARTAPTATGRPRKWSDARSQSPEM